jgi:uncharacterized protein
MIAVFDALRASSYTIHVDLPSEPDRVMLVHGYTGAYDLVSPGVAAYVRSLDPRPPKPLHGEWTVPVTHPGEVTPPPAELVDRLVARGHLTASTREEERARYERIVDKLDRQAKHGTPSYVIMPTYDCNLRCSYCFQDHMRTDARFEPLLRMMTPAVIDRLFDAMAPIEARHGWTPQDACVSSVCFFGGEPLLRRSRPVVERIIEKARASGRPFRFSAVSNMTQCDAYYDLFGPQAIATIQVTIDGPPREHDKRRIHADGSGSFAQIAKSVEAALDRGVCIDARMNIDRNNVEFLPELARTYAELGWSARANFSAYVAPIHAGNGSTDKQTTFNSAELRAAVRELREHFPEMEIIGTPDDGLRGRIIDVFNKKGDPLPIFKASYCGAHTGMYVIDPFGDIYACWERTGDRNVRIGWLDEDGPQFVADRLKQWRGRTVATNDTCAQCRYSMYCGGGCAVYAEGVHGTMYGNYCDAFGRRFRETVAEAYAMFRSGHRGVSDSVQALRQL